MSIDDKKIDSLAHLARLEFEVDTSGVDPLIYMSEEQNVLRADIAKHGLSKSEVLKNAPSADSDYFKVPKVITK